MKIPYLRLYGQTKSKQTKRHVFSKVNIGEVSANLSLGGTIRMEAVIDSVICADVRKIGQKKIPYYILRKCRN